MFRVTKGWESGGGGEEGTEHTHAIYTLYMTERERDTHTHTHTQRQTDRARERETETDGENTHQQPMSPFFVRRERAG